MPWAKVDDGWWCHPKVVGLPLAAAGLWISALCWSESQHTDLVPPMFLAMIGATDVEASGLVAAGLWAEADGGWLILRDATRSPKARRPNIPKWLRAMVYERDGHRCVTCGTDIDLTLDHIFAWSKGGPDTAENFQTMCRPCNSRKGDA